MQERFKCSQRDIVLSTHGNVGDAAFRDIPLHERCLPAVSVSTVGLLSLLRWGIQTAEKGGFISNVSQDSAKTFFSLLLLFMKTEPPKNIAIELTNDWAVKWPRPNDISSSYLTFVIQPNLTVDISELKRCCGPKPGGCRGTVVSAWWKVVKRLGACSDSILIVDLLRALEAAPTCKGLLAQLLWHIAWLLEASMMKRLGPPDGAPDLDDDFGASISWFDSTCHVQSTLGKLPVYVLACVEATGQHNCFSFSSDKAICNGLPVCSTQVILPTNVAFECVPAVMIGGLKTDQKGTKKG